MEIEIKVPFKKGHEGFTKNGFSPNNILIEKEDILVRRSETCTC